MDNGSTLASTYVGPRSLRYARVIAFTFVPADASRREARAWLVSQCPYLSTEDRDFICDIHLHDTVVREWRMNS